jgi:F-type H+-transporting ATPase subunit a
MEQFQIKRLIPIDLFGWDVSFTNASLFMVIAMAIIPLFFLVAMNRRSLVPGRLQSTAELSYEFIANMVRENVGEAGMKYFPWVFTIFMFILVLNLLGLMPYSFTVTSHIIVTFALAAMVWLIITAIGFMNHGVGFLKLFVPSGVPWWLMPIIIPIELIS